MQKFVASLIHERSISSAHDISEGGLAVTLLEKGFNRNLGFDVSDGFTPSPSGEGWGEVRKDAFWFGEAQSRVVITCSKEQAENLKHKAASAGIPVTVLGTVTSGEIKVNGNSWGYIDEWKEKYDTAIEKILLG